MTNRQIVSDIRSMFKLISSDNLLNDRVVLSECRSVANMLVKQTFDKRKGWNSPNLFAFIPCLEMEKVPLSECCEYTSPYMIAKSKVQLPKIGEGLFGSAIQAVLGLDGKKIFKETNPRRFANTLKLGLKNSDVYFWILNDYLYITNEDTASVNLYAYFTEDIPNSLLYPGEDCDCKNKPDIDNLCANPLDHKFYFLDNRLSDLKNIVYKNLLSTYFGINNDNTSNNLDEQTRK